MRAQAVNERSGVRVNGQRDWRETQWSSRASRENIDQASASHPPKPILRKGRLFCSVRGLLTKYSDLYEI